MMVIEVWTNVAADTRLKGSLNEALSYIKRLKEEIFTLKNDQVETSDIYFEKANEKIAFSLFGAGFEPGGFI